MHKPLVILGLTLVAISFDAFSSIQVALTHAIKDGYPYSQDVSLKCRLGNSNETELTTLTVLYRPILNKDIFYLKSANHQAMPIRLSDDDVLGQVSFKLRPTGSTQRNFPFQISDAERDLNLSYLVNAKSLELTSRMKEPPYFYYGSGLKINSSDCHVSAGFQEGATDVTLNFENTVDTKFKDSCIQESGQRIGTPRRGAVWSTLISDKTNEISFHADMWGYDYADYSCEL